jgi:hypothetical protein
LEFFARASPLSVPAQLALPRERGIKITDPDAVQVVL